MICQMVNGARKKLYIFKELKEETFMTPILSLHNIDVTAFLAVVVAIIIWLNTKSGKKWLNSL